MYLSMYVFKKEKSYGMSVMKLPALHYTALYRRMRHEYDIFATVRAEKGQEISGACGQLVVQKKTMDIEDL